MKLFEEAWQTSLKNESSPDSLIYKDASGKSQLAKNVEIVDVERNSIFGLSCIFKIDGKEVKIGLSDIVAWGSTISSDYDSLARKAITKIKKI